jgi:hypothetical protein
MKQQEKKLKKYVKPVAKVEKLDLYTMTEGLPYE